MFKWMFLPFKRYAEFSCRSCRKEYWLWFLFTTCVLLAIMAPWIVSFFKIFSQMWEVLKLGPEYMDEEEFEALFFSSMNPGLAFATLGLMSLYTLATFVPNLALGLRRFHDCGIEPLWYWLLFAACFVPFFFGIPGLAIWIIAGFVPGNPGPNQFGDAPLNNPRSNPDLAPGLSGANDDGVTASWPTN